MLTTVKHPTKASIKQPERVQSELRVTLDSMRFGAFVPQGWRHDLAGIDTSEHWPTMLNVAKKIEELGYESLWAVSYTHLTLPTIYSV